MKLLVICLGVLALLVAPVAAQGVGNEAPAFNLVDSRGDSVSLEDFRGQPLILNVWASWCAPCVEELPFFQQLYSDVNTPGENLDILLVNNGENPAEAVAFLQGLDVTLPTALDPTREQREAFKAQDILLETTDKTLRNYRVRGMPTTFFIDADGVVRGVKVGLLLPSEAPALLASIGVTWEP